MPKLSLPKEELFERLMRDVSSPSGTPLTFILGSGFSFPIVPTTVEIVHRDLAWWRMCHDTENRNLSPDLFWKTPHIPVEFRDTVADYSKEMWANIHSHIGSKAVDSDYGKLRFDLDTSSGLPVSAHTGFAYRAALSADCTPGLYKRSDARQYFLDVVRRIGNRLNPAHLYLAEILAWLGARECRICGTILTTNFDPLLQRALQLVNIPYFVSDRPDTLQYLDDDAGDTLHLVYAHGSVYRYLLLNSEMEISKHADRNRSLLQPYFAKHSIVIVGYSGWDDAIMQGISAVEQFQGNVYWCDRGKTIEESSLSPAAKAFIQKSADAFYIPIEGANQFLAEMHLRLVGNALPQLFRNPIGYLQDRIDQCQMEGLSLAVESDPLDLSSAVNNVKTRLTAAQTVFEGSGDRAAKARSATDQANDLYFKGQYVESIPFFETALEAADELSLSELTQLIFRRGYACWHRGGDGDQDRGIQDYTEVIEMEGTPRDLVAKALVNRGVVYGQRGGAGDHERQIRDYTEVIQMEGAPSDQVAKALFNRALTYGQRGDEGDREREIQDYTQVIQMEGTPRDIVAKTLFHRGEAYGERGGNGDQEREIQDYTQVIQMEDAPSDQVAMALVHRGITYGQRGDDGDQEREIQDYTRVIEMEGAPTEQVAEALVYRGITYGERGADRDQEREIQDYTRVIEMEGAPTDQVIDALVDRGLAYQQREGDGDQERAIQDYTQVIQMEGIPSDQVAIALVRRGLAFDQRRGDGDQERKIHDYTQVIEMEGAPGELVEIAKRNLKAART